MKPVWYYSVTHRRWVAALYQSDVPQADVQSLDHDAAAAIRRLPRQAPPAVQPVQPPQTITVRLHCPVCGRSHTRRVPWQERALYVGHSRTIACRGCVARTDRGPSLFDGVR